MTKQTKSKEELRRVGPKFARNNVLPQNFQIRRPSSPMADLLDAADGVLAAGEGKASVDRYEERNYEQEFLQRGSTTVESTPVDNTGVFSTPVKSTVVNSTPAKSSRSEHLSMIPDKKPASSQTSSQLPQLDDFLDRVLPRFPPARQAILLRLYRWNDGSGEEMVVSTPKLAAHTNMDEKACRAHLHALIAEGFLVRSMDGEQIAKFGGSDRAHRGLLLRISGQALHDLLT